MHVDSAVRSSQSKTISERSSLKDVQMSSVGGGAGSKGEEINLPLK